MNITEKIKKARTLIGTHNECAVQMGVSSNTLQKCINGDFKQCADYMQRHIILWLNEHRSEIKLSRTRDVEFNGRTLKKEFIHARLVIGTHISCAVKMDISGNTLQKCVDGNFLKCNPKIQAKLKIWFKKNKSTLKLWARED